MTTNKNKTATAPTYTITSIIAKNSAPSITNKAPELKKASIKNKTEWTGFLDEITITAQLTMTNENK